MPYLSAVVLTLIAFVVRYALDPVLEDRSPMLLFTASVVIAAGRYGTGPGLLSMVLSLIAGTLVFVAPGFPPDLTPDQIAGLGVFIVTCAAMLSFAEHLRTARERERELHSELQQVQTQTAMGTMAATLAHELNQPLGAAANYVAASKRMAADLSGELQPTVISGLGDAERQIHRAGEIIRHARNLVSNVSAVRETVPLRSVVANVVNPLRASGSFEGLALRLDVQPGAEWLVVNPVQIEQVLLNVIRNAGQAVSAGESASVTLRAEPQDGFALIEIRDLGPGIAEDRMKILFSPQARPSDGGLGLGLPISRTIIEAHGGKMWARNNPEGGASFFFTVPRAERT